MTLCQEGKLLMRSAVRSWFAVWWTRSGLRSCRPITTFSRRYDSVDSESYARSQMDRTPQSKVPRFVDTALLTKRRVGEPQKALGCSPWIFPYAKSELAKSHPQKQHPNVALYPLDPFKAAVLLEK